MEEREPAHALVDRRVAVQAVEHEGRGVRGEVAVGDHHALGARGAPARELQEGEVPGRGHVRTRPCRRPRAKKLVDGHDRAEGVSTPRPRGLHVLPRARRRQQHRGARGAGHVRHGVVVAADVLERQLRVDGHGHDAREERAEEREDELLPLRDDHRQPVSLAQAPAAKCRPAPARPRPRWRQTTRASPCRRSGRRRSRGRRRPPASGRRRRGWGRRAWNLPRPRRGSRGLPLCKGGIEQGGGETGSSELGEGPASQGLLAESVEAPAQTHCSRLTSCSIFSLDPVPDQGVRSGVCQRSRIRGGGSLLVRPGPRYIPAGVPVLSRVFVTGVGVVSSLGLGRAAFFGPLSERQERDHPVGSFDASGLRAGPRRRGEGLRPARPPPDGRAAEDGAMLRDGRGRGPGVPSATRASATTPLAGPRCLKPWFSGRRWGRRSSRRTSRRRGSSAAPTPCPPPSSRGSARRSCPSMLRGAWGRAGWCSALPRRVRRRQLRHRLRLGPHPRGGGRTSVVTGAAELVQGSCSSAASCASPPWRRSAASPST